MIFVPSSPITSQARDPAVWGRWKLLLRCVHHLAYHPEATARKEHCAAHYLVTPGFSGVCPKEAFDLVIASCTTGVAIELEMPSKARLKQRALAVLRSRYC